MNNTKKEVVKKTVTRKSVRVTRDMKDRLVSKAVKDKFFSDTLELEKLCSSETRKLFVHQWVQYAERIEAMPRGFFPECTCVTVVVNGESLGHVKIDAVRKPYAYDKYLRLGSNRKMEKLLKERISIKDAARDLSYEIYSFLSSIKSTRALYSLWPESREVIDFEEESEKNPPKIQLPSVIVSSLNNKLGLPRE